MRLADFIQGNREPILAEWEAFARSCAPASGAMDVRALRDHANATQAMLLYMQDTWDYLKKQEEVTAALDAGLATQAELLAAGYNSNPRKLPGYLTRGGAAWRTLIPEETKMYLRLYSAVEADVDFDGRS